MSEPAAPTPPPLPDHVLAVQSLSYDRTEFRVYLAEASRITMRLVHNYQSRQYQVSCTEARYSSNGLDCEYSEGGPLNSSGTSRLSLSRAVESVWDYDFDAVHLDGAELTCTEQELSRSERRWWCYHPSTYAAWERARDAALEHATDPLERWQRQEGEAPVWYQGSPYSGEGDYTTGVMLIEPYVTYDAAMTHVGETEPVLYAFCVPVNPQDGSFVIHTEDQLAGFVPSEFYLRGTYLCEWEVFADGEWTLTLTPSE